MGFYVQIQKNPLTEKYLTICFLMRMEKVNLA